MGLSCYRRIKEFLDKYKKDSLLMHELLNMLLVWYRVRYACLIENPPPNSMPIIDKFFKLLKEQGNILYREFLPDAGTNAWLITYKPQSGLKNLYDYQLGKILGFYCYNHIDFRNENLRRTAVKVKVNPGNIDLTIEVCETAKLNTVKLKEYYNKIIPKFNSVLNLYGFTATFYTKQLSIMKDSVDATVSWEKFKANKEGVKSILYNHWFLKTTLLKLVDKMAASEKCFDFYKTFIDFIISYSFGMIHNSYLDYFQNRWGHDTGYEEIQKILLDFELQFLDEYTELHNRGKSKLFADYTAIQDLGDLLKKY